MDRDAAVVFDIVVACRGIERNARGKILDDLTRDDQLPDSVIRKLEVIGEATKRLSAAFRNSHPSMPWKRIAGMRDRLIHGYDDIDLHKVWDAATIEVPQRLSYLEPLVPPAE